MAEAIARLSTTRATFNRWLKSGRVRGVKVGRQWRFRASELQRLLEGETPTMSLPVSGAELLNALNADSPPGAPTATILVNAVILAGIKQGASDLYLDVVNGKDGKAGLFRIRIDGASDTVTGYDARLHRPMVEEVKRRGSMDVTETRLPQNARIGIMLGPAKEVQLDVVVVPALLGESVSIRIIDPAVATLGYEALGIRGESLARIKQANAAPQGLTVLSGVSGSGKTVSAYILLNDHGKRDLRVVTVEQPVLVGLQGTVQVLVDEAKGMDMLHAIRAADLLLPDLLFVSDLRDAEIMAKCLDSAHTRAVITTFDAADAASAVQRLHEWGADPLGMAEAINIVVGQRLARRVCAHCAQPAPPDSDDLDLISRIYMLQQRKPEAIAGEFLRGRGCERCRGTGFRGRCGLFEVLSITPAIEAALIEGANLQQLRDLAIADGMETLVYDGLQKARDGIIPLRELRRVVTDLLTPGEQRGVV